MGCGLNDRERFAVRGRTTDDPAGHYSALELDPAAAADAITAAFRRKARLLHPDVPRTGDAAAFIRVKTAYEVLGHAERRAAYDRSAQATALSVAARTRGEPDGARPAYLPMPVWLGLGGIFCLAAIMALVQLGHHRPRPQHSPGRVATAAAPAVARVPLPEAAVLSDGPTTHYVLPTGGETVLWQDDKAHDAYVPAGYLAPFTPVRVLRLVPEHGLAEIELVDQGRGFIDVGRLAPGDRPAARRAYCFYNAGPLPANGEVLERRGTGTARLEISNRTGQPAVVKLRDASGRPAASVFLAPGNNTSVDNLPDTDYRPEFAVGELWSRACNGFAAGMRAQRFAGYASSSGLSPLVIPPPSSAPRVEEISEATFERE
jgi:hypothetical protein